MNHKKACCRGFSAAGFFAWRGMVEKKLFLWYNGHNNTEFYEKGVSMMSQITKRAMADALKQLLEKKPLSKVTITDITESCGISRMTFYYHFQDIYDLVDWICEEDGAKAIAGRKNYATWQEGFHSLCCYVLKNKTFIENVYRSVQREQIENFMYRIVHDLLMDVVEEQAQGLQVRAEDKQFVADFYKYAFVGVALNWVKTGMKESPEELTEQISTLLNGQFRLALQNYS